MKEIYKRRKQGTENQKRLDGAWMVRKLKNRTTEERKSYEARVPLAKYALFFVARKSRQLNDDI
jgi:hypothetical protein